MIVIHLQNISDNKEKHQWIAILQPLQCILPSRRTTHVHTELYALLNHADLVRADQHSVFNTKWKCLPSQFNSDSYFPNSVVMSSSPCWGTIRKSPSLLYIARFFMELLHVYTCIAIPCLVLLSPAPANHHRRHYLTYIFVSRWSPATVWSPSIQSTSSSSGISNGFHLIWFGFGCCSFQFVVRNQQKKIYI